MVGGKDITPILSQHLLKLLLRYAVLKFGTKNIEAFPACDWHCFEVDIVENSSTPYDHQNHIREVPRVVEILKETSSGTPLKRVIVAPLR